jgi:ABC-2 type transport system ATP-binding protein
MADTANQELAITVQHISKDFKLPHERNSSVKSLVLNFYRRRSFERQRALRDVSFEVKKGEFFGIIGRNGSGKSTLLKLLAGIYSPTKGYIQVNGKLTPFIELGVGFNPELTGRENVFLNGALLGFTRKEVTAMYDDVVAFAELERFMDQKLKNYSSGMQVRLAFSIAIRAQGDILLLDEVLAVGDAAFQQKCYNYFEELKSQGKTVVFVSHDMAAVRRFCSKAIYVREGMLIQEGTPAKIAEIYEIDNINASESNQKSEKPGKTDNARSVMTKISKQTDQEVPITVIYKSSDKITMYAGISVLKDGVSVAEINTLPDILLTGNGELAYILDTTKLNPGVYEITVALFNAKNKELLSLGKNKSRFVVKGSDNTRGAALRLEKSWRQAV